MPSGALLMLEVWDFVTQVMDQFIVLSENKSGLADILSILFMLEFLYKGG